MKIPNGISIRLEQVKKHFDYTNNELGKVCNVSYAAIAKILNNETKDPSISIAINLQRKLSINLNWFLLGEGAMFENTNIDNNVDEVKHLNSLIENQKILIEAKDSEINTLKKIITLLEEKIEQKLSNKKVS